jgi:hypothetical protein
VLLFASCIDDHYGSCLPPGGSVYVKIHWDNLVPGDSLPVHGMHIQMYPEENGSPVGYPLSALGGEVWLPPGMPYMPVCFGFVGMEYLGFHNMDDRALFSVSNQSAGGTYRTRVEAGNEEPAVYESYPYTFYTTRNAPPFTAPDKGADIDTLHCYPENALHEFTYLIYGVEGAENVAYSRGAISGMSGAYYPVSGAISHDPATVLFRRSLALEDGRYPEFTWHTSDTLQYVTVPECGSIPVCPKWFPAGWANPTTGWKGDWIIGAFSVFGLASPGDILNQLTIECFLYGDYYYNASWGYWDGQWEDEVATQMQGALGYWDDCPDGIEKGSREAQTAWRKHNGGFDIILANDGRMVIPSIGMEAPVSGWGENLDVPLK